MEIVWKWQINLHAGLKSKILWLHPRLLVKEKKKHLEGRMSSQANSRKISSDASLFHNSPTKPNRFVTPEFWGNLVFWYHILTVFVLECVLSFEYTHHNVVVVHSHNCKSANFLQLRSKTFSWIIRLNCLFIFASLFSLTLCWCYPISLRERGGLVCLTQSTPTDKFSLLFLYLSHQSNNYVDLRIVRIFL